LRRLIPTSLEYATAISGIDTRVTSAEGTITSQATAITDLTTTVGTNTASISTQATSINGIEANYGVKVDINGRVTGFGLNSTVATATPTSEFYVIADKFAVVDPASTASTPIIPFTVAAGLITMGTNVRISGDLVTTGTISADRLSIDGVTLDTDGAGNLIVASEGVGTSQMAPNAATFIASGASSGTVSLSNNSLHIVRQITFTGTGVVTEIIATASYANAAAGGSFLLDFNGTTVQGVLSANKTLVTLVAGVTSLVGVNTLTLYLDGPVFGAGSIDIYNSYIRALESRR
jgi:hypothetical protein